MDVRLVATDLDGTLVHSDGSVTRRTRDALGAAEAAGIEVVFVTGRPLRWAREVFEHVGRHGLAILSNGALVWDVAADEPALERCIDPDVARAVCADLRGDLDGLHFAFETVAGWCAEPDYPFHVADDDRGNRPLRRDRVDRMLTEPVLKLMARAPGGDPDELVARAAPIVGERLIVTHSSFPLLEMSAAGVTKATTLAVLAQQRGIGPESVVALGDMPNDIPMLEWAGTSYAMANAHESVIAAADHVAPPNDEDGVAQVLETLLS